MRPTKRIKSTPSDTPDMLSTVNRALLDFDFERVCSVTLSARVVYCCLVCGRFFRGPCGDKTSPLVVHALETDHHIALGLERGNVVRLPDGGAVPDDETLADVGANLKPVFDGRGVEYFARKSAERVLPVKDLHENKYFPGLIGLNDLKGTDFVNSTVNALVRVKRLREFFLLRIGWESSDSRIVKAFGELTCQMFTKERFKSSASPHELLQAVGAASGGKFQVGKRSDATQFLAWLLHELHKGLKSTPTNSSIIHECFQGQVRVDTTTFELKREFGNENIILSSLAPGPGVSRNFEAGHLGSSTTSHIVTKKTDLVSFTYLSLDLPTTPLFKNASEGETVIPKMTLLQCLEKYDGVYTVDVPLPGGKLEQKRYRVTKLPEYMIIHLKRFTKNEYFVEKNRTVVTLSVTDLDMSPFCEGGEINSNTKFDLVANVCHDGGVGPETKDAIADGTYSANVYYPPKDAWFKARNLDVQETLPQLVAMSDTLLAVYARRS